MNRIKTTTLRLLWLLLAGQLAAASDRCAICGGEIGGTVYLITDQVTRERKNVCGNCAKLDTICYHCGLPVKVNPVQLPDGRLLCARDAKAVVLNEAEAQGICDEVKEALGRLFSRFLTFPEKNTTITLIDRVNLLALFKVPGNDYACPNVLGYVETTTNQNQLNHKISILSGMPHSALAATSAHEWSHVWLNENLPAERKTTLSRDAMEGFCELVAFMLMDSQGSEAEKSVIRSNAYTRGQIHLFLEAERRYGFNEVVDWIKHGLDGRLDSNDLARVRVAEPPRTPAVTTNAPVFAMQPLRPPETIVLRGIFWSSSRPLALINGRSFGLGESGRVFLGETNAVIRCLEIRANGVKIQFVDTGQVRELRLEP